MPHPPTHLPAGHAASVIEQVHPQLVRRVVDLQRRAQRALDHLWAHRLGIVRRLLALPDAPEGVVIRMQQLVRTIARGGGGMAWYEAA